MKPVYILEGRRSPMAKYNGLLAKMKAPEIAAQVIKDVILKSGQNWEDIKQVILGQVLQSNSGQAPARQAALLTGHLQNVPCVTINKVCGSGLQSIIYGFQGISLRDYDLAIVGGMENMSYVPEEIMMGDGLTDPLSGKSMGLCAESCAEKYNLTRVEQDEFAIQSYNRSLAAQKEGHFQNEITPILVMNENGESQTLSEDDGPSMVKFEKIPNLKTPFKEGGTITAANASTVNDGASILLLGSDKFHDHAKFRIVAHASHAQEPEWFTTAPIESTKKVLEKANMKLEEIDLFEINEAFSVVTLACMKELKIHSSKVNVLGGAVSLGHPLGSSGSRIIITLMNAMKLRNKKYGLASICIGGGEALSMIIEKI